jgi:hypothetical protein
MATIIYVNFLVVVILLIFGYNTRISETGQSISKEQLEILDSSIVIYFYKKV